MRRVFAATWPLAVVLALAACAPQGTEPPRSAQAPVVRDGGQAPSPLSSRTGAPPYTVPPPAFEVTSPPPAPIDGSPADSPAAPRLELIPPPGVAPRVAVGLLLPLSGADAELGRSLLDAAALATLEIGDDSFVLLPRDTKGTAEGTREAAVAALESGAKLLIGPIFAADVAAISPLARAAGVNVLAFSNDRMVAGEGTFVIGVPPAQPIERILRFAAGRGLTRFAALIPEGAFGRRVAEDLPGAAARAGGVMAQVEVYQPTQEDMSRAVRRLAAYDARREALQRQRAALESSGDEVSRQALRRLDGTETLGGVGFDAVLLPDTGRSLEALAPLLPYYDIDTRRIRVLGVGDWRDRALFREPALAGAWVAGPSPEARAGFEKRFEAAYGRPAHPLAALAYDAAALAAVLASGDKGPDFSLAALTARNGFAGSTGIFRLNPDGTAERGLAVMEVRPDGLRVIDPEPQAFSDPGS